VIIKKLSLNLKNQENKMKTMKNKKAAMELSMSTIVIVVLAMALLVGGIVLVKNILGGANESVDSINDKVLSQLNELFSDNKRIVVMLGSNKIAKVKASNEVFGVAIGASTIDGDFATRENIAYQLELDSNARINCLSELGQIPTEELFLQKFGEQLSFDNSDGSSAGALIQIQIPEGTIKCTQKVFFYIYEDGTNTGQESFSITIV
jgi:hypothetical protein